MTSSVGLGCQCHSRKLVTSQQTIFSRFSPPSFIASLRPNHHGVLFVSSISIQVMDSDHFFLEERKLEFHWQPQLVVLSYCLAWLGAYTCTQVAIHAKYAATQKAKWWWTFLGSVVFGFSAIWCMHFGEFGLGQKLAIVRLRHANTPARV